MLNKLFRKNVAPPFDIEKAVGNYLLTLPRCTRRVLAVSRSYGDTRYNYEMTVDAASLAAWAVKQAQGGMGTNNPASAARNAISFWLFAADMTDNAVSRIPEIFFTVLREYHSTFLEMAGTQVLCNDCHQIVDVSMKNTHLPPSGIFDCWRYEWNCSHGHLLYQDEVGRHGVSMNRVPAIVDGEATDIPTFLRKNAN